MAADAAELGPMPDRLRVILMLNGFGLLALAVVSGWLYMFVLLQDVVLWPVVPSTGVAPPGDDRAWRAAHLQALMEGLLLIAVASCGPFIRLRMATQKIVLWSAIVTAWMFAIPFLIHAWFGTRGLAFGGGPFKPGIVNDVVYLLGWPPVIAVHVLLALCFLGLWNQLKTMR
jgi:hypothetical protein